MKYGTPRKTLALGAAFLLAGLAPAAFAQEKVIETPKPTTPAKAEKAVEEKGLSVGDAAPKMEVEKWVKGAPVEKFESGKLYVVEFWATWCPPCKKSIPHLTELQKKFKDKVTFIGVSIWEENVPVETGTYLERVNAFVKDYGQKMDYTVAFGGEKAKMSETWMKASGSGGIPTAFIVNKEGKVAWIGHPMVGLEETLDKVVAGTFDLKAETAKATQAKVAEKRITALRKEVQKAMQAGDKDAAGKAIDELIELDPAQFGQAVGMRFKDIMADKGDKDAYTYAKKISGGAGKDNAQILNALSWTILDDEAVTKRDLDVAMTLALRADELTKHKDPMIMDTLARAYFEKGDTTKAVEIETAAIKLAGDDAGDELKESMQASLKKFKEGKK